MPTLAPDGDTHAKAPLAATPNLPGARVKTLLGKGGMGSVWLVEVEDDELFRNSASQLSRSAAEGIADRVALERAVSENLDALIASSRHCAAKVIAGGHVAKREARRFMQLASGVPDTPRFYGGLQLGEGNDAPVCLYMETEPGMDLDKLIRANGKRALPVHAACDMAALMSRALRQAHAAGITHRDVKPENFFVTDTGRVMLLDLGLAKSTNAANSTQTLVGRVSGTPTFMSPEQARGEIATPKCDVFSLGMVLVEMYSGIRPYQAANGEVLSLMNSRANLQGPAAVSLHPEEQADSRVMNVFPDIGNFLQRMIDPDPAKRPAMEDVARFFHLRSSFGGNNFENEFTSPETYGDYRLRLSPSISKKPSPDRYSAYDSKSMLQAIDQGAREFAESSYDFLGRAPVSSRAKRTRGKLGYVLLGAGAVAIATVGGAIALKQSGNGKPNGPSVPVVAPVTGKNAVVPVTGVIDPPKVPAPGPKVDPEKEPQKFNALLSMKSFAGGTLFYVDHDNNPETPPEPNALRIMHEGKIIVFPSVACTTDDGSYHALLTTLYPNQLDTLRTLLPDVRSPDRPLVTLALPNNVVLIFVRGSGCVCVDTKNADPASNTTKYSDFSSLPKDVQQVVAQVPQFTVAKHPAVSTLWNDPARDHLGRLPVRNDPSLEIVDREIKEWKKAAK